MNIQFFKSFLVDGMAKTFARSYYLTQVARRVVQIYDNDCNPDIKTNGELLLIKRIVALRKNGVFFDVGANIGDWSSEVIEQGFKGQMFAVDPLRKNIAILERRFSSETRGGGVKLLQYAVSDSIGEVNFFSNADENLSGHDSLHDMNGIGYAPSVNVIKVKCATLDQLSAELKIHKIDFLKIDIEGHEYFALKGAVNLLKQGAIDFIQLEFGHAARAAKVYLHDIVNFANSHSYDVYVIKRNGLMPLNFTPFTENRYSYVNFLLTRKATAKELQGYILRK